MENCLGVIFLENRISVAQKNVFELISLKFPTGVYWFDSTLRELSVHAKYG